MIPPRLVTADDLCVAVETTLTTHLADVIAALELNTGPKPFTPPKEWVQIPTWESINAGAFPSGAITSPGLVSPPERKPGGGYDATWRIGVGVYDRGTDYHDTQRRIRTWAALVRATLTGRPSLGGVVSSTIWRGEEYRQAQVTSRSSARTLGGCAVAFDVTARNVVDLDINPLVQSVAPAVSVTSQE